MRTVEIQIERKLIREVIKGNEESFAELYNIYAEKVFYFSLGYLKTSEMAEDLTQEVFVKLWETRERLDPENSFSSYLFTIARNAIFNLHRKKLNELAYFENLNAVFFDNESKTEQDFHFNELQKQIESCIESLPFQRKKVFIYSRMDGLSHKEISSKLGIAEKTVAAHIRLALQTLRKNLK